MFTDVPLTLALNVALLINSSPDFTFKANVYVPCSFAFTLILTVLLESADTATTGSSTDIVRELALSGEIV